MLIDMIQSLAINHSLSPNTSVGVNFIQVGLFILGALTYYLAIKDHSHYIPPALLRQKSWLFLIANLFFASTEVLNGYKRISYAVEFNTNDHWIYQTMWSSDVMYLILFTDLANPIWYMKLIFPVATFIPVFIADYHYDLGVKTTLWLRFWTVIVYLGLIFMLKEMYNRRVVMERFVGQTWIQVHEHVFKYISNPILVVNKFGSLVYSNDDFERLCKGDLDWFYINLTNLTRFRHNSDSGNESIWGRQKSDRNGDIEINIMKRSRDELVEEESEMEDTYSNLAELLEKMQSRLKSRSFKSSNELLYFKGKMLNRDEEDNNHYSYTLKVFPTVDLEHVALIVQDTSKLDSIENLEAENVYKDKLLANVSHDMKAPLNGSIALLEAAKGDANVPQNIKVEYLNPAYESCMFLSHLINDILDFAQIKAQKLRMHYEFGSLFKTVESCCQLVQVQARRKNLQLLLDLDENIPAQFATDHTRVSQILLNLLSNAIKFTFNGTIQVFLRYVEQNLVQIEVTDTGIGIKEDDMNKLFSEFTHINYERQGINKQGVGLGLMICNCLAKLLGPAEGKGISVASVYGEGSQFSLILEAKPVQEVRSFTKLSSMRSLLEIKTRYRSNRSLGLVRALESKRGSQSPIEIVSGESQQNIVNKPYGTKIPSLFRPLPDVEDVQLNENIDTILENEHRILIVDDDPFNVLALESLLKPFRIPVDVAFNGLEALQKIEKGHRRILPDIQANPLDLGKGIMMLDNESGEPRYGLVFMDCNMPIMGGLEATNKIKEMIEKGEIDFIPIVGCTGMDGRENIEDCISSGMIDIISKPISKIKLEDILVKYYY